MALVSVIIPAYNGASRYLEDALHSILAQTFRDGEIIVVDDASTDDTGRVVLRFPQARYFRRAQNGGQAAARNDGARLATGTYLSFLDQDDLWESTFLQEALAALKDQPDAAVVHCDGYQVDERNQVLEYDTAMKHTKSITQLLRGGHDVATSGSLFRKACFDAVGGYDDRLVIWEDIDLAIRLSQRFRLIHLPKPLYRHRLYSHNVSRDIASERALLGRFRFLEKYTSACKPGMPEAKALNRDWAHYYGDLGKHYLHHGRLGEARQAFKRALHYHLTYKGLLRLLRAYLTRGASQPAPSSHTP